MNEQMLRQTCTEHYKSYVRTTVDGMRGKAKNSVLRWRVSKLIFARAQNDHFQYGKVQSQTVANGHRNIVCIIKGVSPASFVR